MTEAEYEELRDMTIPELIQIIDNLRKCVRQLKSASDAGH